jgi:predicted ribonuclease YlaK
VETVLDNLRKDAERIKQLLTDLSEHSSIGNVPSGHIPSNDPKGTGGAYFVGYSYWNELPAVGKQLQSQTKDEYLHFLTIIQAILGNAPLDTQRSLREADRTVRIVIEQQGGYPPREAFSAANQAIDKLLSLLASLIRAKESGVILVADTNALLHNPALDNWEFEAFVRFEVVLVPTVSRELDALKINHRNEEVRRKAEGLIRRIGEYHRRGSITTGVTLRQGRSRIRAVPIEPKPETVLPWLDPSNDDDRLLASTVTVMRQALTSPVLVVTRDLNLRIKAEHARIPCIDPPEPPVQQIG